MYPSSGNCLACVYPCTTCTTSTNCLTCKGNLDNRELKPTCKCSSGFYNLVEDCVKCELPCLTCNSATSCITRNDCDKT